MEGASKDRENDTIVGRETPPCQRCPQNGAPHPRPRVDLVEGESAALALSPFNLTHQCEV